MASTFSSIRRRRRRYWFVGGVALALAALFVLVGVRANRTSEPDLRVYLDEVQAIATRMDDVAIRISDFTVAATESTRSQILTASARWEEEAAAAASEIEELAVPEPFLDAHAYLRTAGELRLGAAQSLRETVVGVLAATSVPDEAAAAIDQAGIDLALSDTVFGAYLRAVDAVLAGEGVTYPGIEAAGFGTVGLAGATLVNALTGSELLATAHDLRLDTISLDPEPVGNGTDGVLALPYAPNLGLLVTVTNAGSEPESVRVVALLEGGAAPQTVTQDVGTLDAGASQTVALTGLEPATGGVPNQLTVQVSGVAGEEATDDNTQMLEFTMTLG